MRMIPNCEHSEQIDKIVGPLIRAIGKMESARKDSSNPHFNSKYADLTSIMDVAKPELAAEAIAVLQPIKTGEHGSVIVATILMHESGQWIGSTLELTPKDLSPQAAGSAMTYARRYALGGILGMTADDDDGNAASGSGSKAAAQAVAKEKISTMKSAPAPSPTAESFPTDPEDLKDMLYQVARDPSSATEVGENYKALITEHLGKDAWLKARKASVAGSPSVETSIRRLYWMWKTKDLGK